MRRRVPPCPVSPIPDAHTFYPTPLDAEAVAASARELRVVATDNDPYCPAGAERSFARPLHADVDVIPGAGHSPHVETPDVWFDAVTRFLKPSERPSGS